MTAGIVARKLIKLVDPADSPAAIKRLLDLQLGTVSGKTYGTPIGRLFLAGKDGGISAVQFYAAMRWERLADQATQIDLFVSNHPTPAMAPDRDQFSDGEREAEVREEFQRQISKSISDALENVRKIGPSAERTLRQCCEENGRNPHSYEELMLLRLSLDSLASTWGLTSKHLTVRKAQPAKRQPQSTSQPETL